MTLVAVSQRSDPSRLLAAVLHLVPQGTPISVSEREFGALLVAGEAWAENDDWFVYGTASQDPWGSPGRPAGRAAALDDLDHYGSVAMTMVAGPLLAVDLKTGIAHRPLNGIVGFGPHPDDLAVASTASPHGSPAHTTIVADASPAFSYQRLATEIRSHLPPGTRLDLGSLTSHPWPQTDTRGRLGQVRQVSNTACVFDPPDLALLLQDHRSYAELRDRSLPELHHRCQQVGLQLHAPAFERPVLDQLGFGVSGLSPSEAAT